MAASESGIARRDFLRVIGITGLGLGFNLQHTEAAPLGSATAEAKAAIIPSGEIVVGLDIGTSKVCAVVAERQPDGSIKILGVGQAPSRGVRRSEIVDSAAAGKCVREALVDAEAKSDVMIGCVRLAVTGRQSIHSVRCVWDVGVEIERLVFAPVASAEAVLSADQKELSALVIDMGGGTTDYAIYACGALVQSDCFTVGSQHIANDLSLAFRIPMARAERLALDEGSVLLGRSLPAERIVLPAEPGFADREVGREMLNTIIHCRVRETFERVKRHLETSGVQLDSFHAGVHLTGGCSMLRGIDELAQKVFGIPAHLARVKGIPGFAATLDDPQYSCAIGLVKFG